MGRRGYDGDSGADKEIIALATQAEAFRKGIQDKTEQPDFIDSHGGPVPDAPRVFSIGYHPPNFSEAFFTRIDTALAHIDQFLASADRGPVVYTRLSDLARVFPAP